MRLRLSVYWWADWWPYDAPRQPHYGNPPPSDRRTTHPDQPRRHRHHTSASTVPAATPQRLKPYTTAALHWKPKPDNDLN